MTHTTGRYYDKAELPANDDIKRKMDIAAVKARIGARQKDTFSIDYLAGVGVSAMGFPVSIYILLSPSITSVFNLNRHNPLHSSSDFRQCPITNIKPPSGPSPSILELKRK